MKTISVVLAIAAVAIMALLVKAEAAKAQLPGGDDDMLCMVREVPT